MIRKLASNKRKSRTLSALIEKFQKDGNQRVVDMIAAFSPVAWSHIQLAGNYVFGNHDGLLNLYSMLESVDPLANMSLKIRSMRLSAADLFS
ncbi:Tn3 family transposase [Endozoicomonas sp. GU-1]|uniref:Tn3 family transposase n=1 Tax=Endozoicomonas sp. GU-1 TaxID=3009078 RepID=UPI0022B35969|nr:Tn3 family transposase [Endozoicomonas sp. GU-1]WBA81724.1 Tn3 family transposase [Endozoicomonas sp. GU-1]